MLLEKFSLHQFCNLYLIESYLNQQEIKGMREEEWHELCHLLAESNKEIKKSKHPFKALIKKSLTEKNAPAQMEVFPGWIKFLSRFFIESRDKKGFTYMIDIFKEDDFAEGDDII